MTAAVYGLVALIGAALLALIGVLRAGRAPAHLADVTGLQALADELRIDRDDLRVQITGFKANAGTLTAETERWRAEAVALRGEVTALRGEVAALHARLGGS